ncbi:MAG: MerR family transcriptional regulator [Chloroflexi bacterium]|nr:MerR family transcriptional regulator [Chloroflexota bacterium]
MFQKIDNLQTELKVTKERSKKKQSQLDSLQLQLNLTDEQIKSISDFYKDLTKLTNKINELQGILSERKRYIAHFSIGALARRFSVDNSTIKTWSHKFSDYFSPSANPPSGHTRLYNQADVTILTYIAYWYEEYADNYNEADWDEEIHAALKQGDHLRITSIHEEKIFQDVLEDFPEVWDEWLSAGLGGMADGAYNGLAVADAYKRAGDVLVESGEAAWDVIYPTLYNYRHCIELYIKIIVDPKRRNHSHNLEKLLIKLNGYAIKHYKSELPTWFIDRILEFQWIDSENATAFRYDDEGAKDEVVVVLPRLKQIMDILQNAFHRLVKDYEENTIIHAQS